MAARSVFRRLLAELAVQNLTPGINKALVTLLKARSLCLVQLIQIAQLDVVKLLVVTS